MENPFEEINQRLDRIEKLLLNNYNSEQNIAGISIMNIKEVSKYLDLSVSHLYKLTSRGDIPFSKRGKRLYFDRIVIDKWALENVQTTNSEIERMAADYLMRNPLK